MKYLKYFESTLPNTDCLYKQSSKSELNAHKRCGMSDDEYFSIRAKFKELGIPYDYFLPGLPPTKHNNDPSSFCSIKVALIANSYTLDITKYEDEWWSVEESKLTLINQDRFKTYMCDTIQGVFDLLKDNFIN